MNRRDFGKAAFLGSAGLLIPTLGWGKTEQTLADIIRQQFPLIKDSLRNGNPFASPVLNQAVAQKRILLRPLGVDVKYRDKIYPIEQASIPMTWTARENRVTSVQQAAALGRALVTNTIHASDDFIADRLLPQGRLVISREYNCWLSPLYHLSNERAMYHLAITAYSIIPE